MAREPGTSFPSETRQMTREERIKVGGGGPSMLIVIIVAIAVLGALVYALAR
jgi:hypothetical protein